MNFDCLALIKKGKCLDEMDHLFFPWVVHRKATNLRNTANQEESCD